MTVHLTIWWLWWPLIGVYVLGVIAGMAMTLVADDVQWWLRPAVLIWPAVLAGAFLWGLALFMTGRD